MRKERRAHRWAGLLVAGVCYAIAPTEAALAEDVVWTGAVGVSVTGNSLQKTAPTAWENAGAASANVIKTGYGWVEFTATETNTYRFCGLSYGDTNLDWRDIDFAIYLLNTGSIDIYEYGVRKGGFGAYASGDRFRIEVRHGVVRYRKNGTVVYTSSSLPRYPLRVDTALFTSGATLTNVEIGTLVWANEIGVAVSKSGMAKATGTAGFNAGASSANAIEMGDGFLEFTPAQTNSSRVVGLGSGDMSAAETDVEFGIHLRADGSLGILESGVSRGDFGSYAATDRFRVQLRDGTIEYLQNGSLLYISGLTPTYPLRVDTSFDTVGGSVTEVVLEGLLWTNEAGVEISGNSLTKTGAIGWNAGAASTNRLGSGDGFVEVVATQSDTRRGFGFKSGGAGLTLADIDFALLLSEIGTVEVHELGALRGSFGSYVHGDRMRVEVHYGTVRYLKNGAVLYTSAVAPSYPAHVETILYTPGGTLVDVTIGDLVWTSRVGMDMAASSMTKAATSTAWDSGAVSTAAIQEGWVEFTASETNSFRMIGLSSGNSSQSYTDIDFALYLFGSTVQVYELGALKGSFGSFMAGDRMAVQLAANVVRYLRNGVVFYTSSQVPNPPLLVDSSFYHSRSSALGVRLIGPLGQNVLPPPTVSPLAGTYFAEQVVTIGGPAEAAVHYTVDVTEPTEASPLYSSPVSVSQSLTLKAKAFRAAWAPSSTTSASYILKVPAPSASPGGGTFGAPQTVTLDCSCPGATIHYTTNGTTPTQADPFVPAGSAILIDRNLILKFAAWKLGWTESSVSTTTYTIASVGASPSEAVVWTNALGVSVAGSSLTKTAPTAWENAGAASENVLKTGYGWVEFTASETNTYRMCGLSNGDSNLDWRDIDFAILLMNTGGIEIYEYGTRLGVSLGGYLSGDRFRIEVRHGVVRYLKNGVLLYTSLAVPRYPLRVDTALFTVGATLTDVRMGNVVWSNETGISAAWSGLTKMTGTSGFTAGASSANILTGGDAFLEFVAAVADANRVVGLGTGDVSVLDTDVEFGVHLRADGSFGVLESGISRGSFGTYQASDRFRVQVRDGVIQYLHNGTAFYSSLLPPSYPLRVDTAFDTIGGAIAGVVLEGLLWQAEVGAETIGNSVTKTGTVAAWNAGAATTNALVSGDGFVEVIATQTDKRRAFGLKAGAPGQSYSDIDFALLLTESGGLEVHELGALKSSSASYVHGDRLRVEIHLGSVRYLRNETVLYTSTIAPAYPLHAATALYTPGATLVDVSVGDLIWTDASGVQALGASLVKTAASTGWNSGAVSTVAITEGKVEFTATDTATYRLVGLSRGDFNQDYTDIDFGIYLGAGAVQVFETGVFQGSFGSYAPGDQMAIELSGNVVRYLRNGIVFRTSSKIPNPPLLIDTSFQTPLSSVFDMRLTGTFGQSAVDAPTISPPPGTYLADQTVTVSVPTHATTRFTLDGTEPTETSAAYSAPFTVAQSATVKARAFRPGWVASPVSSASYVLKVPKPSASPSLGTFNAPQPVTLNCSCPGALIHYTTNGAGPTQGDPAVAPGGTVLIDRSLVLNFGAWKSGWSASDLASASYTTQVPAPTFSPIGGVFSLPQDVTISVPTADVQIHYTTNGLDPTQLDAWVPSGGVVNVASTTLRAKAWKIGWSPSLASSSTYTMNLGPASTPTIAPPGGTTAGPLVVTLASATPGATIRYTLDGSNPNATSRVYSGVFWVTPPVTVLARAYAVDMSSSGLAEANYSVDPSAVALPRFGTGGGFYVRPRAVSITTDTPGATVHYTTDGNDPTDSHPSATTVVVDRSMVLKARAFKTGMPASGVVKAVYYITGAIAAGTDHALALKADGTVWAWGRNTEGQLGDGTTVSRSLPTQVLGVNDVIAVSAGQYHSLAVKADGTVWGWGTNTAGQLGPGSGLIAPIQLSGLAEMVAVAAGVDHSVALAADGTIWTWGANSNGRLCNGGLTGSSTPTQVVGFDGVDRFAAGSSSTLVVRAHGAASGSVWVCGSMPVGEATTLTQIFSATTDVGARDHVLARRTDGAVWAWGRNDLGQLGDGKTAATGGPAQSAPLRSTRVVAAGSTHSLAAGQDGKVWGWGSGQYGENGSSSGINYLAPQQLTGLNGVLNVAAGGSFSLALKLDGSVWAWGFNGSGQLGDATLVSRSIPRPVTALSLVDSGSLNDDPDGDGLPTWLELLIGSDPLRFDSNDDGLSDGVAHAAGLRPSDVDMDGDGLPNAREAELGTDPFFADTDGDGIADGQDCFSLDGARSECLQPTPGDITPPVIQLLEPTNAQLVSSVP